ncbi:MAG: cytochrome c oxidase subunit II [Burkholderiaceae bacterium]|nr:cytochrome c oxidase subunit II [Burkholderiaceae bacterium]
MHGNKISAALLSLALLLAAPTSWADDLRLNMVPGASTISQSVYDLHMTVFWIMVAIGVVVFTFMFYSVFKYRRSKGAVASNFHENAKLEFILMLVPFLILIVLAVPATKVLYQISDSSDSAVTIKIIGYQWRWRYEYLNENIDFYSDLSTTQNSIMGLSPKGDNYLLEVDHPVVVPINQKIRFLITSNDVIHSWWVPELGVKKDALPGFIHDAWAYIKTPGIYRGQCAELCGANHGYMPIVVEAVTQEQYAKWVAAQQKLPQQGDAQ